MSSLPVINKASISFIRPIVLPDLFAKCNDLKKDFSFLGSTEDYAQYYKDLERLYPPTPALATIRKFDAPAKIPEIGSLLPLRWKHSMHSYWKFFRLSMELANKQNIDLKEFFLLLPLIIEIPVEPVSVDQETFDTEVYAYLFPFGVCMVNMDIAVNNMPFDQFLGLIHRLKGSNIARKGSASNPVSVAFKKFSHDIAVSINSALFGEERPFSEFQPHTFIFVSKTSVPLLMGATFHKMAVAAAMTDQTFTDISSKSDDFIQNCFQAVLQVIRPGEVLRFNTKGSFVYASPLWKCNESSLICMSHNYQSCLNVLFAVNSFLTFFSGNLPKQRLDALKKCLASAFPDNTSQMTIPPKIYFGHAFEEIAPLIGLKESLRKVKSA